MPVNDTTANRSYQKPNIANTLSDDVGRLRSALDAIDTDMASKAPSAGPTFTGVTTVAAGSAAAPSLTFTGATSDTGLYSPGADQVAISTGGTGRVFVDVSGNVGVGSLSSGSTVHVTSAGSVTLALIGGTTTATSTLRFGDPDAVAQGFIQYSNSVDSFLFGTNAAERLRLTSDGKLGVGTSAPDSQLHVKSSLGSGSLKVADSGGTSIARLQANAGDGSVNLFNESNYALTFGTNNTERARIDCSGRLLVGTSSNTGGALLQVNDNRIRIATAKTPASATDTGSAGEICWDANYIYVCTATNTWKRTALSTW